MNRHICVHGHFYQPPRENPWLEEVEVQDSAFPHHDWNKRITWECYAPNGASRILDLERKIVDIVNNYAKISFNVGPTLLSWMANHEPEAYQLILQADRLSQERFSGHGSAIAQVYNHVIMPLANSRDKYTQIAWGLKDFQYRFGRKPEGMWLSETAVDGETLSILAEHGIKFTILAPHQAHRIRRIGGRKWKDVSGGSIDPKAPYLCKLPSGKTISLFFYDGPMSQEIAFGDLLKNGEVFAKSLANAFTDHDQRQLVHIATDGETYGHHHRHGDMALAYCLHYIESNQLANITNYAEYLEKNPPSEEVEIVEDSSWSCVHGVDRWKDDCGCNTGMNPGWHQRWRAPLREAMDWLRDNLAQIYEEEISKYVRDPWGTRNDYIDVVLDRCPERVLELLSGYGAGELQHPQRVKVLKLLEMQRCAMFMYTSCGWFFDEISGTESVQVMRYAARAVQLAEEITGRDLESHYVAILQRAPSNLPEPENGAQVYEAYVKPAILDFLRVGAHYAISSMFEEYSETTKIYCYTAQRQAYDKTEMGQQKLAVGRTRLRSDITTEEGVISFAVLHLGDHNLIGGVREYTANENFESTRQEIQDAFQKNDISEIVSLMDKQFGTHNYSLRHLFKDQQRHVLERVVRSALTEVETSFRQIYEHHCPVMQVINEMGIPLPKPMADIVGFVVNKDLRELLEGERIDVGRLGELAEQVRRWPIQLDTARLSFVAGNRLNDLTQELSESKDGMVLLETIEATLRILHELPLQLDVWKAQNVYFSMSRHLYKEMEERMTKGDESAKRWIELFDRIGDYLNVKVR